MNGAELITAERRRQVEREGFDTRHDEEHVDGELVDAALCYLAASADVDPDRIAGVWPWEPGWWKPSEGEGCRDLVKAGALVAAEIDRRLAALPATQRVVVPRPVEGAGLELLETDYAGKRWLVGFGHLDPRLFVALAVAHVARANTVTAIALACAPVPPEVVHRWALERNPTDPSEAFLTWSVDRRGPAIPVTVMELDA